MNLTAPIIITGFMGCGKTEVARTLATHLSLTAIDLDDKIATLHGRTAAQLIDNEGEPVFRAIETDTLREVLKRHTRAVVALGGGAWITEQNRALVAAHKCVSVWLDAPFELCWQRIAASVEDRPLGRTREQAQQLFQQRRPIYQLAEIHIRVLAHEAANDIVGRIETALASYFNN